MKETDLNLINEEEDEKEIPSHLDEVSIKNMTDTNPNMKNELFFNVPSKEEMIKVENCFFLNDIKKISTFYFCSCSKEEFYPICEPCAKQCHKRHNPTQTIKGIYICKCGECDHKITEENEKIFQERKKSHGRLCFYTKLMEVTPGQGYFKYKNKIYCGVCMRNCVGLEKDEKDKVDEFKIKANNREALECMCSKHFEPNLVNLNLDFSSKPKFNLCFENINFNVLSKVPLTQEKYINYLISQIQHYMTKIEKGSSEMKESKKFFTDFNTGKILECFSLFSSRFENKFFFIEDYLKDFPKETLIQLLKINEDITSIDEGIRGDFFKTKFNYAELIFNYLIRRYNIQNNNIWNIRTLVNMNLYQRRIYIHEAKSFFKFQNKEDLYNHKLIRDFIENILELYETVLHFCENDTGNLKSNLFDSYFPTLNRITKYMIKINFLTQNQTAKYYGMVYNTVILWFDVQKKVVVNQREEEEISIKELQEQREYQKQLEASEDYKLKKLLEWVKASQYTLQSTNKPSKVKQIVDDDIKKEIVFEPHLETNHLKGVYYLMKSILYSLLYENDKICFNYFKGNFNPVKDKFIFAKSPLTDKICKIFVLIIQKFYRKDIISRTIIYDYYIQKILELLIEKDDNFYMNSLENLKYIDECDVELIKSNDLFEDASNIIEFSFLNQFNSFCEKLGSENRKYLNYYIKFDEYLNNSLVIIKDFEKYVKSELPSIPDITMKYINFLGISNHPNTIKRIKHFQRAANYSLLFSRIEEFISIYYQGKKYNKIDTKKTKPILDFILTFLFLLVYKNSANLALIMNIKPLIFVQTFSDTQNMMFSFLERICEMFHTGEYIFDNFYFYSECLCMTILQIENKFRQDQNLSYEAKIDLLETLGHVLYLTNKSIHNTTLKQYDNINIIDRIQRFTERVKTDERFMCIKEIIESYLTDVKPNRKLKIIFKSYFIYLCKLIQGDFSFFTITSNKDIYLIDMKSIMKNLDTLIFKKITDFDEEYCILRYYFASKLKLNITTNRIKNQAIRLFKNNNLFEEINNDDDLDFDNEESEEDDDLEANLDKEKNKIDLLKSSDQPESPQQNEDQKKNEEPKKNEEGEEAGGDENNELAQQEANEEERHTLLSDYDKRIQIEYINASLINLSLNKPTSNKKSFEKKIKEKINKLHKIAKILYQVVIKFNEKIDIIMEDDNKYFPNPYNKYLYLLKYYEHVILRPTYKLINLFMLNSQFILGTDCIIYQSLVLEVLKLSVKLYLNIEKLTVSHIEEFDKEKKYYNQCFEKPIILRFENISLKKSLLQKDIEDIVFDIKNVHKIKYYYIADIFHFLIKNIELMLYTKPKFMETVKTKTTMSNYKKLLMPSLPDHINKMNEIIKDYKNSFEKTFDIELTLFNALEESEKEMDIEIGKELLIYLLNKLGDDLTDENCYYYDYDKIEYREAYLSKIKIRHFKLQNSNIIAFLNGLFYNYSEKFQSYLKESIGKYFDNIFLFLLINIIFACNINENMKLYNIDQIVDYNNNGERNRSLCLDLCTGAIKLIQNMCEGHNQIFQQRFFNYKLNVDSMNYIDKKTEKEIDFNMQKEEDDEYYLIYNIDKNPKKKKKQRPKIIPSKRALMLNSQWFKNVFVYLNNPENQHIFRLPELKIIDILRQFIEQLDQRKKEGRVLDEVPDQEAIERERKKKEEEDRRKEKPQMHTILQEFLKKPINLNESRRSSYRKSNVIEVDDKEEEEKDMHYLKEKKYSLLNFLFNNMRLIIDNIHISDKLQSQMFRETQKLKSTEDILDVYQHFADLVVEMIQGTGIDNFDNFYKKLTRHWQVLDDGNNLNSESLESFLFIHHCLEISKFLWKGSNLFNSNLITVVLNLFKIINNIITQQLNDIALIKILTKIFPPEKLLNIVCEYLKGLTLHHLNQHDYDTEEFEEEIFGYEFDLATFNKLKNTFKSNQDIHEDTIFSLASQIYLFITILAKNYKVEEALKILDYENKELHQAKKSKLEKSKSLKQVQSIKDSPGGLMSCPSFLGDVSLKRKKQIYKNKKGNVMSKLNNYIITAKFFHKVIKNCEFMIENGGKLNLKTVYFIVDPRVYYIDNNNIENFFNEVDRSSSTTKLKAFIKSINNYLYEVIFKYKTFQKDSDLKNLYEIDYKNIDFLNLCCSLAINFNLVLFLDKNDAAFAMVNIFTIILSVIQILFNLFFLAIYYRSKYKFNVFLEESEYSDKELDFFDRLKVYVLDSFIFHEDVYLMILIMTMDILGLISDKLQFLYSLQLLSVIKFVETIKIIVVAFKTQMLKLVSILGFLLIFIFFYANISYRFLRDEFNIEIEGGEEGNVCSSLLECTITYFNHGIRSGGGIGDLLPEVSSTSSKYWFRFFNDFIFFVAVVLMLLNMINGVIVSIFSEIREKTNFKESDQNNKCFICNIDRAIFERFKIKFEDHKKFEHNIKTYIRFLVGLKLISEKDLDADQSFIISCIKKDEIKVFPVGVSSSTGAKKEDESTEAEEEEGEEED